MSKLNKKIAYLQGLAEGLNVDRDSKEGKLFTAIMDVLDEVADGMEEISQDQRDLEEYMTAIDEDLGDLEEEIYGEDDCYYDADEDEDFEEEYIEVECPGCHDIVRFESSILGDEDIIEVTCPNCDEVVFVNDDENFEMGEDDEEFDS